MTYLISQQHYSEAVPRYWPALLQRAGAVDNDGVELTND